MAGREHAERRLAQARAAAKPANKARALKRPGKGNRNSWKREDMSKASDALAEVKARFGISLREVGTGGGCIAWEARLETGHWIVATNEALSNMREQIQWEEDNEAPMGWGVGFYPNDDSEGIDTWMGQPSEIAFHLDLDAYAQDLADVIAEAFKVYHDELRK